MNLNCMKSGYPPVIIRNDQRLKYYETLDKAHVSGIYDDFIKLINDLLVDTLNFYLKILGTN